MSFEEMAQQIRNAIYTYERSYACIARDEKIKKLKRALKAIEALYK